MKKLITFSLLMLSLAFQAQTSIAEHPPLRTGIITGTILDGILNEPLPYVNIVIRDLQGNIITGSITKEDGTFFMNDIPDGKNKVSIEYLGYKTVSREITIDKENKRIDFGIVKIFEQASALDEVEITAEVSTIQQKVDRKVITIGKDLAASGTASELMVGIPSVSVDAQTGDISLRGNQNVRVMVDGKLSNIPTAQLLKQIPSTAIKSVELITNPSAKYNPEGMSGIINIVLHKNTMVGFNGNLNIGLAKEIEAKFNSSLDMNYRNGKFNVYTSYSNNISKNRNRGHVFRPENNSEQFFKFLDKRQSHLFKVGLDYYLNDKHTISVFTNQNISESSTNGDTDVLFYNDAAFNQKQVFLAESNNNSGQYNLDYKFDIDEEGHNIELEINHNIFDDESPARFSFPFNSIDNYLDDNKTNRVRTTVNLDYVKPLSETTKLELGLQARLFNSDIAYASTGFSTNPNQDMIPDNGDEDIRTPSTDFDYTRDIYSAYATYSKKFEKWTYQVGLRAESVAVDAIALNRSIETNSITPLAFENDYFQLYPSAFFTYSPSEKNAYQLSYSRRVDRPGIGQVNPIKEWSTPLISSFGKQDLEPQFTNSLEVNYTRALNDKKGSITAGVFYRVITDEINRALFIDRTDVNSGRIILTHDNFDDTSAYGLEISSNYRPTQWWSINGSFDLYSQTQKGIAERFKEGVTIEDATISDIITDVDKVDNVAWNFRMFNSFKASKSLSFTAFGFYRGSTRTLQFDIDPMYFVNIGARYTFLDSKATFSLNYNDIFDTMKFAFEGTAPFKQIGAFNWESNTVQASLAYRFGGGKYRAKSRKQRDNNEKSSGGGFL